MESNPLNEDIIVGEVEAIYYENSTNFYKVMRVRVDEEQTSLLIGEEIVITGQFASIHLDTAYQFFGKLTQHAKYGEQFAVSRYQQMAPTSEEGLVEYLSGDRFKGIGKVLAQRIVDELGQDAIDTIIADAKALRSVKGLTGKTSEQLRETLLKYQGTERVFMKLSEWGFGPRLADKIYKLYKSQAVEQIKANPYELMENIEGIGFQKADELAEKLGFEALAIERIMAGIIAAVTESSLNNGDTYVEEKDGLKKAQALLEKSRRQLINHDLMQEALERAISEERLVRLSEGLMIPSLYHAELGVVSSMSRYLEHEQVERFPEDEIDEQLEEVVKITGIQYDEQQRKALKLAIQSPLSIITGGPGTGKTTLIRGLIHLHALLHDYDLSEINQYSDVKPVTLAAPTGRAAKRMQEMTGIPSSTIHRLIGFTRDSDMEDFYANEIEGNLLIVDEMSMVDTWLMNWLMQAIPYQMQIVFVGDKDQLPSVGPGKVFSDLIESRMLPTISLKIIYRQAQDSSIIKLAHSIREGHLPDDFLMKQPDRSFIQSPTNQVANVVQQIVAQAQKKGFDANSLQVLAPMYKGPAGINNLNQLLQQLLNPPMSQKREIDHFDKKFRVGDKVLQLVNNTEEGVYNGDIGKIEMIHLGSETESKVDELVVSFDDESELVYKRNELDQLTLAYCCSIHKSQGSEYPLVILPLVDTYSRMLRKDILYTAITRAQSSLVMVGNPASFDISVSREQEPRLTFLRDLLEIQLSKLKNLTKDDETAELDSQVSGESEVEAAATTVAVEMSHQRLTATDIAAAEPMALTEMTLHQIDPMIGMNGLSPYDFIAVND